MITHSKHMIAYRIAKSLKHTIRAANTMPHEDTSGRISFRTAHFKISRKTLPTTETKTRTFVVVAVIDSECPGPPEHIYARVERLPSLFSLFKNIATRLEFSLVTMS